MVVLISFRSRYYAYEHLVKGNYNTMISTPKLFKHKLVQLHGAEMGYVKFLDSLILNDQ